MFGSVKSERTFVKRTFKTTPTTDIYVVSNLHTLYTIIRQSADCHNAVTMPIQLSNILPAAFGGANIAGSLINSGATQNINQKQLDFSREMYDLQRKDSIDFWNMQNEYNSPQAQMARLQAAGLNPNMVYGSGSALQPAQSIKTPDVQNVQLRSPEWGNAISAAGNSLAAFVDMDVKQAQADNLKAQNNVIIQDAILKAAQTDDVLTRAKRGKFDLGLANDIRQYSVEAMKEGVRQTRTQTDLSINRDQREAIMTSSNIKEAVQRISLMEEQKLSMQLGRVKTKQEMQEIRARIVNLKQQTANLLKDEQLKQFEINMRKLGVGPNDPWYYRGAAQLIQSELFQFNPDKPLSGSPAYDLYKYFSKKR